MATPLHDPDALRSLADGPAGPARDWARVHLAVRGVDAGLPDDPDGAAVALVAGCSGAPLLDRLQGGRRELQAAARLADEICRAGALPEDGSAWIEPLAGAVRGRGWASDASFARLLAELGHHAPAVLGAAARVEDESATALLPRVVLGFAAAAGRDVETLAGQVAGALAARMARDPDLLPSVLAALGAPWPRPAQPIGELEEALYVGGTLAGVDETPPVSPGRGAVRRRMQQAAQELLGGVEGPAAALVRGLLRQDGPDAATLLVAATWLRCAPRTVDAATAVVEHGAGEAPALLSAAARTPVPAASLSLGVAVAFQRDPPAAVLAGRALAAGRPEGELLVDALRSRGATALDEPRLQSALAVALARDPAPVLRWMDEEPRLRPLALYHARHTAHEEVLERLLDWPRPETSNERRLLARALASQGDRAAVAALARLREDSGDDELAEDEERARAILGS